MALPFSSSGGAGGGGDAAMEAALLQLQEVSLALHRWTVAKSEGQALLTELANASLSRSYMPHDSDSAGTASASSALWGPISGTPVPKMVALKLESKILQLTAQLRQTTDQLHQCFTSTSTAATTLRHLAAAPGTTGWLHRGFGLPDVASATARVARMMEQEVAVAEAVAGDAGECGERDTLTLYSAAWLMQPYVDREAWATLLAVIDSYTDAHSSGLQPG